MLRSADVPPGFEIAPCDFCGSNRAEVVFSGPDRLLGFPGMFTVVRCTQCGLLRQNPRPKKAAMGAYYPPAYEPFSIAIDEEASSAQRWGRRYGMWVRRRAIERIRPSGRLLDVGCATGNFLNEMARTGHWQVEGVEPNAQAAAYASRRFGIQIHRGELVTVELPLASFDVITMWNVLEHLYSPMTNLRAVGRLLKPGGIFVFSIPNLSGLEARWFGRYWIGWDLPRHLYFPTLGMAEQMLEAVGLKLLRWDCLVGAYQSFLLSLRFLLTAWGGEAQWVRIALGLAGSVPMQILNQPLFWILTRLGRASLITGIAQLSGES